MTRDEAILEAERKQLSDPNAKWIASRRDGEWVVASIGLAPTTVTATGTATKPPPVPQEDPQSPLQRVTTLYGSSG